ncbi:response regulator [Patescibacteria group bacterium]|nr:response regulator [Patescibacteria group bacterium]MBU1682917.1 response regulator [Patescibacteria group bacterium]MBU1934537.1 response regulator [Patescibacteria group bacterium]
MTETNPKILIAEDDPSLAKAVSFALTEAGFIVEVAVNGKEALKKVKNNSYDLILLDLIMPERTGFEVLHELQLLGITTPAIVYSNMFEEISKEEALKLGAKDYFAKAKVSLDDIVEKVKKFTKS